MLDRTFISPESRHRSKSRSPTHPSARKSLQNRSRSISPSPTPKRRRVETNRQGKNNRKRNKRNARKTERSPSPLAPSPRKIDQVSRMRSPSSSSISRSPSPDSKPSAIHRLPRVSHTLKARDNRLPRTKITKHSIDHDRQAMPPPVSHSSDKLVC